MTNDSSTPRVGSKVGGTRLIAISAPLPKLLENHRPDFKIGSALRGRLVSELTKAKIEPRNFISKIATITGRSPSTVRRWVAKVKPGLPDLESFAGLCLQFGCDSNYLLGLVDT